jgi:uncharacterized protein YndB with AHSA1/START domain
MTTSRLVTAEANLSEDLAVVITRILDAPRHLVFKMFTDPQHLAQFWGAPGCTSPVCEMDVRPGGVWRHVLRTPDGAEYPSTSVYLEVVQPERLVYQWAADNSPAYGDSPPPNHVNTITFEDHGGKTKITLHTRLQSVADRDALLKTGFAGIVGQSLDRLTAYLKTI